jgi:starvation-inducible DNA-binding protein
MDELAEQMKVALASTFAFYLKAHNFHWNVEGANFPQYHSFFGDIYADAWGAVDAIAEHLRTLKSYAPGSFARFKDLSVIEDELNIPPALSMCSKLETDNQKLITELTKAYVLADKAGKPGISNFFHDRIDIHEKHGWMLRSIIKA